MYEPMTRPTAKSAIRSPVSHTARPEAKTPRLASTSTRVKIHVARRWTSPCRNLPSMRNTDYEVEHIGQLYRDRADCENGFDEIKNQWGWGGYTTHDIERCAWRITRR
jgi:hypothetical protein